MSYIKNFSDREATANFFRACIKGERAAQRTKWGVLDDLNRSYEEWMDLVTERVESACDDLENNRVGSAYKRLYQAAAMLQAEAEVLYDDHGPAVYRPEFVNEIDVMEDDEPACPGHHRIVIEFSSISEGREALGRLIRDLEFITRKNCC